MKKIYLMALAAAILGFATSSCTTLESDEVKTTALNGEFVITAMSSGTARCSAHFTAGHGGINTTTVDLKGGDSVSCNGAVMSRSEDGITHEISYSVDLAGKPGDTFIVIFHRQNEADYNAKVILPDPILLPVRPPASLKKDSGVSVSYVPSQFRDASLLATLAASDPKEGQYNMDPNGNRIDSKGQRVSTGLSGTSSDGPPEHGMVALKDDFPKNAPYSNGNWPGKIQLIRAISGVVSAGFNGRISAQQILTIPVTVTD